MPIILIWNMIAGPSAPLVKRLLNEMNVASLSLEAGLKRRFDDAETAERLTSAFPVFRFTDEALSAFVSRSQFGLALTAPQTGWGERMARLGVYWNIPKEIGLRVRETELLPGLLGVMRKAVAAIRGSVEKFEKPDARMFARGAVSAVDLLGMGAMTFRALGTKTGREEILARFTTVKKSVDQAGSAGQGVTLSVPSDLPLVDQLDEFARYITGAIILVPAITALAIDLLPTVAKALRHQFIEKMIGIESQVFDIRAMLFAKLSHSMAAYAQAAVGFADVMRNYLLDQLDTWVKFNTAYMLGLYRGVSGFVTQLSTFFDQVRVLAAAIVDFGHRILAIDLSDLIHKTLVALQYLCDMAIHMVYDKDDKPARYVAPSAFPVKVGDMVLGTGGGATARSELSKGTGRLLDLLKGSFTLLLLGNLGAGYKGVNLEGVLKGLDKLGPVLNTKVLPQQDQPAPTLSTTLPADLIKLIIEPAEKGVNTIVTNLGNAANALVHETTGGLTNMLQSVATAFDDAGDKAARLGLGWAFGRIASDADDIAAKTFPLEAVAKAPPAMGAIAAHFAAAISGGFRAMEGVIGGFLGFVIEEWTAHLAANADTPVEVNAASPRKLIARARLGRVHLPQMVMHLPGQPLTEATANLVARRFATEVRAAYARGQSRLSGFQATAAAGG